ncbi:MAG TPA: hypothetical protein PKN27_04700 [Propionibacteriaceae bacterium]|nr:hypothetical protein [Propionibacteriaceae bacterium]
MAEEPIVEPAAPSALAEVRNSNVAEALAENFKAFDAGGDEEPEDFFADIAKDFDGDKPAEEEPAEEKPSEEDKPAEEKPAEDEDDIPPNLNDKRKAEWRELRASREEARIARQKAERLLAERDKELQEKTKFVEEAEKELAISRVEGTREFKETVDQPLKAIEKAMSTIAKDAGVSVEKLYDALEEPDFEKRRAALKEVTADMDDMDRQEVYSAAKETQILLSRRAEIFAKATEAAKEAKAVQEARAAKEAERAKAEFNTAVEKAVGMFGEKKVLSALVGEGETAEQVAESVLAKVKQSGYDGASVGTKAYAAAAGVILPKVVSKLNTALAEAQTLRERVAELSKQGASVSTGEPKSGDSGDDTGEPFEDLARDMGSPGASVDVVGRLKSVF